MKYIHTSSGKVHICDKRLKALCGAVIKHKVISDSREGKLCSNCVDRENGLGFGRTAV